MKDIPKLLFKNKSYFLLLPILLFQGRQIASKNDLVNSLGFNSDNLKNDALTFRRISSNSFSSNGEIDDLKKKVNDLEYRLSLLEHKLKEMEEKEIQKNQKPLKPRTFDLHDKSWK